MPALQPQEYNDCMRLYKYVTDERIDVLQHALIRFSQPSALNDPFDMQPLPQVLYTEEDWANLADNLISEIASREFINQLQEAAWQKVLNGLSPNVRAKFDRSNPKVRAQLRASADTVIAAQFRREGIKHLNSSLRSVREKEGQVAAEVPSMINSALGALCLTEVANSPAMWAHYASNYTGFVIEFDSSHPFFRIGADVEQHFYTLRKVTYSEEVYQPPAVLDPNGWLLWFFNKTTHWAYEQEWRMLRHLKNSSRSFDEVHLFELPATCITGVIAGPKMGAEKQGELFNLVRNDMRYQHVRCYQAMVNKREGRVDVVPF